MSKSSRDRYDQPEKVPGRLAWPFLQAAWIVRKYVLWPVADSFRGIFRGIGNATGGFFRAFRYRSPFAYIGATLAVTVTAGAVAAAFYFYKQSEEAPVSPVVAQAPVQPVDTVVTPATPPAESSQPASTGEDTLKGVVPSFNTAGQQNGNGSGGNGSNGSQSDPEESLVKPAAVPDAKPLQVAHQFASTFVEYEVGKKSAAKKLNRTSTAKLSRELRKNPPKLPAGGKVPKATVMNVVKGEKNKDRLDVSVSLLRSGATSELRLGLVRSESAGWQVSEVRG
ncbi:MAG: hypothetical protein M3Y45_06960 [Actinomycetota bacterium]|nr:hypothetical protein [Actinomycetota bacterium]